MRLTVFSIGEANIELWSKKITLWQEHGFEITIICPEHAVDKYQHQLKGIHYLPIPANQAITSKLHYIREALNRNLLTLKYVPKIIKTSDAMFSISAVLDLLLIPFLIKMISKRIKWFALFENEVSLSQNDNLLINSLAYIFYKLSFLFLHSADLIFTVSDELKQLLIKNGVANSKIIVTGNAIDIQAIKRASSGRKKYTCDALFMGRINKNKGVFDLVKMTATIKKTYPKFSCWIAGGGDAKMMQSLQASIDKNDLQKNIRLIGPITGPDKYEALCGCQLFVSPSYRESFGVSLLEAICCGRKALAYDLPVYRRLYRHHELITVPVGDWQQLAHQIILIYKSKRFDNLQGTLLLQHKGYSYEHLAHIEVNAMKKLP